MYVNKGEVIMKTTYEERAINFIKKSLVPLISLYHFPEVAVRQYNKKHQNRPLKTAHGATRMVIIRSDYVIKINTDLDTEWGNNTTEVKAYEFAQENGFEYLFAKPTMFTVDKLGIEFEIMPRVKHGIGREDKWWGKYLTNEEFDFVNNFFRDLHEYNVGYFKEKPIFIDYASWCEEGF